MNISKGCNEESIGPAKPFLTILGWVKIRLAFSGLPGYNGGKGFCGWITYDMMLQIFSSDTPGKL